MPLEVCEWCHGTGQRWVHDRSNVARRIRKARKWGGRYLGFVKKKIAEREGANAKPLPQ